MPVEFQSGSFWQSILVWALFLGSVGTLFINSVTAILQPRHEINVRTMIRDASLKLASAAQLEAVELTPSTDVSQNLNRRLEDLSRRVLASFPNVEGGFYLNNERDEFAGFAFPSEAVHGPRREKRRDPPPREEPYIRLQARQTAEQLESEPMIQTRDVGPSRVVVATAPVGSNRPAILVAWLMYRVTGPEQIHRQVYRYQISTFLALAGITAALLLTFNLRRTLQNERESRERLHEVLRRSEHLASLGLLVAQVSHELRNPLAGIRSTVQLWQRLPEQRQSPESMQAVVNAVDRMEILLSSLLQFTRHETTSRTSINLNSIVTETVALLRVQADQQHVEIELNLDEHLPGMSGSASGLLQVVLNLATNALQAMPQSGRLTFRTRSKVVGKTVELDISDTGPGIDPSLQSRLFEPFFTTRASGTGLGLALCRDIILQHGGQIALVPVEPHGTLCKVEFPAEKHGSDPTQSHA